MDNLASLASPLTATPTGYSLQNIDLLALAKQFGTPTFVYDIDAITAHYRGLLAAFPWPKTRLFYAMKANYNLDILRALNAEGASIDLVSPAEAFLAEKAGFTKDRLLYTANNLTDEEVHLMKTEGLLLNLDSLSCLDKLGRAFPGSEVCLRFNSEVIAGDNEKVQTGGDKTKFGIRLSQVQDAIALIQKHKMKVVGLHEHTGSGIGDPDVFCQGMKNLLSIITPESFPDLRFVDFGGGFKVRYKPTDHKIDYVAFGKKATDIFAAFCKSYGRDLELRFEPGKYMVAESGIMLLTTSTLKDNNARLFAGTDSGFSHLIRPMLYNAYHHIVNASNPHGETHVYDVCGNICETGDLFAEDRELPEIREGDILAILNAGAYCMSMSSLYNLRALPAEVVVEKGVARLSKPRLSPQALAEEIYTQYKV